MLPYEILKNIGQKLDFIDVNNFAEVFNLDQSFDKRLIEPKACQLICPICFHGEIENITKYIFKLDGLENVARGMRYVFIEKSRLTPFFLERWWIINGSRNEKVNHFIILGTGH